MKSIAYVDADGVIASCDARSPFTWQAHSSLRSEEEDDDDHPF